MIREYFPDEYTLLTEALAASGYATAGFSTNGHLRIEQGFAQGFETFDQDSCMWGTAECVFGAALGWLDQHVATPQARPFFLWVHLFDPHFDEWRAGDQGSPYYAPAPGYADLFAQPDTASLSVEERTRIAYDRKLRYTDDQLGSFVEALRERGVFDAALFVLAVDHGEEFNEKGRWGHSRSLENSLVHVPLLIRRPNGEEGGRVVDVPVSNLDIAPTVLEFLGLDVPDAMRGASLVAALRGEPIAARAAYGESRRFGLDVRFRIDPARDRKLVLDLRRGGRELYSLSDDPHERRDLAASEPEIADAMERELRDAIVEMESRRVTATRRDDLSAAEMEHLRLLGYLE